MKDTILIVDDAPLNNSVLRGVVQRMNLRAEVCEDGNKALERLTSHAESLACVLLDLYMPKVDGFFTLRQIRHKMPDLPVIIVSGSDLPQDKARILELGARGFIHKPFRVEEVQEMLENVLGIKKPQE